MWLSHFNNSTQGLILALTSLLSACLPSESPAQESASQSSEFRIETDVMEAGKGKPIDQSVTLFNNGVSYEFSRATPHEITVINTIENRVIFLDTRRQVQSRVPLNELQSYIETAGKQFSQKAGGTEKLQDANDVAFDPKTQIVSAGKNFIRYEAKIEQPTQTLTADHYAKFADASVVLNAWKSRGQAPPPFARMSLNRALREKKAIPSEIKRTLNGKKESALTSRIHVTNSLTAEEKKQLTQYSEMILSYATIAVAEYNNSNQALNR